MIDMDFITNEGCCDATYVPDGDRHLLKIYLIDEEGEQTAHFFTLEDLNEFIADLSDRRDFLEEIN